MNDRLEQYPEFKAAHARHVELQHEVIAKQRAVDAMQTEIARAASGTRRLDQQAQALISGGGAMTGTRPNRDELAAQREELKVLQRAVEIQKATLEQLHARLSLEICERLAPAHRELVRKIAHAWRVLAEAAMAEQAFRDELRDNGILGSTLRPMPPFGIGSLNDSASRASMYLLECHEFGFIDRGELPEKLRAAIPPKPKQEAPRIQQAVLTDGWIGA